MTTTPTPTISREERAQWRNDAPWGQDIRILCLLDTLEAAEARAERAEADFANEVAVSAKAHKEIGRLDTLLAEQTTISDEALLRMEEAQTAMLGAIARAEKAEKANSQCIQTADHMRDLAAQEQQRRMKAEATLRDVLARLERIHIACTDTRPKQAVGEMIYALLLEMKEKKEWF